MSTSRPVAKMLQKKGIEQYNKCKEVLAFLLKHENIDAVAKTVHSFLAEVHKRIAPFLKLATWVASYGPHCLSSFEMYTCMGIIPWASPATNWASAIRVAILVSTNH